KHFVHVLHRRELVRRGQHRNDALPFRSPCGAAWFGDRRWAEVATQETNRRILERGHLGGGQDFIAFTTPAGSHFGGHRRLHLCPQSEFLMLAKRTPAPKSF